MSSGRLTICATPIGNLGDVSERLRQTLCDADVVYAEDTRRTAKLLNHLNCRPPLRSLFAGNEMARTDELIEALESGRDVVIVSDAGMPVVSDPGSEAARRAHEAGLSVSAIPGPSAVTTALAVSGFDGGRFVFEGFLPRKGRERVQRVSSIVAEGRTVVFFASPRRLGSDLADLAAVSGGDRKVAICRELSKLHEEIWVGSLTDAVDVWSDETRGEVTVVLEGMAEEPASVEDGVAEALAMVRDGTSASDAARSVATALGLSRRAVYQGLLDAQEPS